MHMIRFAAAVCLVSALATSARADDPLRIAITQQGAWDTGIAQIGKDSGIFKKHGLDVDILYTQAGPEAIQALIAGSVDIAEGAGISAAIGTMSKGAPIKIIGSEIQGAPDQYWYVAADSPIKTIADFNGRTISYSLPGSSSNAALLALIAQYKLNAKTASTGSISATLTQTLTGQVDVGFSAIPFFLDKVEAGQIRIVATGEDVAVLKTRTGRVNLSNLDNLRSRRAVLRRFQAAYRDTIEFMYNDPAALRMFADYAKLPDTVVAKVRGLIPKAALDPGGITGPEQIISEAVAGKFIAAPITPAQLDAMIDIPN
jgi:NitT/TauT family transport system substrate-binding protein